MQLKQAFASAVARLGADHVPSPRMNAELLLRFTLGCDRAYLYAHPERELTAADMDRYEAALAERARGVPAQYITGHQEFWGMDLIVTPAVLIPRPETEHVVEAILELVRTGKVGGQECPPHTGFPRIADVGTGSGCIALALAKEVPGAEIHASDISADALEIARANAALHQLAKRIHFRQADLLAGTESSSFDLIVSNPPYVGESEADQVQLEVRKFEPRQAVFAGPTGLEVIARLVPQAYAALRPGGWLVMEISGTVAGSTRDLFSGWQEVEILADLQRVPRVVRARTAAT
ncbi:MAG TPA: peptide chain release factor N(5)-glutamine methyltransferase [Candidatus Sulfotelmatobacter sp.]|nr:peptide chain release factor N(5)-glutamine methyltransferase [Candidatus Sulfotelmatobacter sp.]